MNTPLPISIRSKRGLQSKLKLNDLNIPIHKSNLRTYELPENTVAISICDSFITYRYTQQTHKSQWGGGSIYAQIQCRMRAHPQTGDFNVYYTGMTTIVQSIANTNYSLVRIGYTGGAIFLSRVLWLAYYHTLPISVCVTCLQLSVICLELARAEARLVLDC